MRAMTPEERFERIERLIEFLAANQAQHAAQMAELSKQNGENQRLIAENSKQITENSRLSAENARQIGQVVDLTLRIGRIVEEQAHRMDDLAERLNTLINVVERYFSNGHR